MERLLSLLKGEAKKNFGRDRYKRYFLSKYFEIN